MCVVQSKKGTKINGGVDMKNQLIGILVKKATFGILVRAIARLIKSVKSLSI